MFVEWTTKGMNRKLEHKRDASWLLLDHERIEAEAASCPRAGFVANGMLAVGNTSCPGCELRLNSSELGSDWNRLSAELRRIRNAYELLLIWMEKRVWSHGQQLLSAWTPCWYYILIPSVCWNRIWFPNQIDAHCICVWGASVVRSTSGLHWRIRLGEDFDLISWSFSESSQFERKVSLKFRGRFLYV